MLQTALNALKSRNVFLSGGAGVGKSFLTRQIISSYRGDGKKAIVTSSTAISAVSIGGQTVHSFFCLGIANNFDELAKYDKKNTSKLSMMNEVLSKTDLIVIDEVSMISANVFEMIHKRLSLHDVSLLVVGDFFQLAPVINQENRNLFTKTYAFESDVWQEYDFFNIILSKNHRTKNSHFVDVLGKIRLGIKDDEVRTALKDLSKNAHIVNKDTTHLFATNYQVDNKNIELLRRLKGSERLYEGILSLGDKKRAKKFIDSLPVSPSLRLKVGAPVIFCINNRGSFYNGQKGVVVEMDDDEILVRSRAEDIVVQRYDFKSGHFEVIDNEMLELTDLEYRQFPLRLAFAITMHKSQGMGLENFVCNVDRIFAPSQFYVALSRCIDPQSLYLRADQNIDSYIDRIITNAHEVSYFYNNLRIDIKE